MRKPSAKQQILNLIAQLEPVIAKAFLDAIAEAATDIPFAEVVRALKAGNIEEAVGLLDLTEGAFGRFYAAILLAYQVSGDAFAKMAPVTVRFSIGDPEIERIIKTQVGGLVKEVAEESRQLVRDMLTESFSQGYNPKATVTQIAGRLNRATGQRSGGVVGLTHAQGSWVAKMRQQLAMADPAYFNRVLRDKRFDRSVRKAVDTGTPLAADKVDAIVARYAERLKRKRAADIALTETMTAINQSKMETYLKAGREGKVTLAFVNKIWRTSADGRVRDSHRAMAGQRKSIMENFRSGDGAFFAFPCDPNAPARDRIRCRCWMDIQIDYEGLYGVKR